MTSLPGSSRNFGLLKFHVAAVLLLVALCGSLLVGCFQNWPITSESFDAKRLIHRSIRRSSCSEDEYWDGESNTCHRCPQCPYGYQLNETCGSGLGEGATCSQCISGYYQRDGECYPCKFCQGRDTLEKCTNTSNTKCSSQCSPGYFMAVNKQCIRIRSKDRPVLPPKITTAYRSTRPIITLPPSNTRKVWNESISLKQPPAEPVTQSASENETDGVARLIQTFAFVLCACFILVVIIGCVWKGSYYPSVSLKDFAGWIYCFCCCKKNKEPERDVESPPPENNPQALSWIVDLELQSSQALLQNGDIEDVVIRSDGYESFPSDPGDKTPNEVTDDPCVQDEETGDQYESEMQHRFAANVLFISQALAKKDLERLKSYFCMAISGNFTENDKESVDSFVSIATILQQRLVCSWSDTKILVNGLESISRPDLAQKLEKLEKKDQQRKLRRSSSRQD